MKLGGWSEDNLVHLMIGRSFGARLSFPRVQNQRLANRERAVNHDRPWWSHLRNSLVYAPMLYVLKMLKF